MGGDPRMDSGIRFIPSDVEPGTAEYDAWAEHLSRPYYERKDPATYRRMTLVLPDDCAVTEQPPKWFVRKVRPARRSVAQPAPRSAPRPRERRGRRSPKATSPSDDDPSEPELHAPPDAERFARALLAQVKATQSLTWSFVRDLGTVTPAAGEAIDRELHVMRSALARFIEAEEVERAVAS